MIIKTLEDLEFPTLLALVAAHALTPKGKEKVLALKPLINRETITNLLNQTNEYLTSLETQNYIPSHNFEEIDHEIRFLSIENSLLEPHSFAKIRSLSQTVNAHLLFFKKFYDYYPTIASLSKEIPYTEEIVGAIDRVLDKFSEVKSDASEKLFQVRSEISTLKGKINQSFSRALSEYNALDYLDDIRETVVENRRVLAVKATYKRKVRGTVLGSSKTGSIIYIEPHITEQYSRELSHLLHEEKEEIRRILLKLTNTLRPFSDLLVQEQDYLVMIDIIAAKAYFAKETHSLLPELTEERVLELREAYHPLLFLSNAKKGKQTFPQTIRLDDQQRIIVISGPNAGGKSITLKTIGLLQLMFQTGLLLPVHRLSKLPIFTHILTDIGDNQSIENHLSTYSYRLKNMNYFLRKCNETTLFLIDEFGTGSDPELGGALAEIFLEEFYHRKAFGVITTHYANLKILANELPFATNANMLFNDKTLEPIYKLIVGEAGSSFTFEVAQKNGIPYSLINRAKKRIEKGKVRFDATIAKLQKERSQMEKTTSSLKEEEEKTREEAKRLETLNNKIQNKLSSYQELYDQNQKFIYLGNKINEIAERYFEDKKRRPLIAEFLKIVETENSKRKAKSKKEKQAEEAQKKLAQEQLHKEIETVRQQKKIEKKVQEHNQKQEKLAQLQLLKVGDRVRIKDSKSVGVIDKIEKDKALINYGFFTTLTALSQLELVEKVKKNK